MEEGNELPTEVILLLDMSRTIFQQDEASTHRHQEDPSLVLCKLSKLLGEGAWLGNSLDLSQIESVVSNQGRDWQDTVHKLKDDPV